MLNWVNQIMIIVLLDIYEVVRVKCLKTKSSLNNLTFPSKKIVTPFVQPLQIDKRGPYIGPLRVNAALQLDILLFVTFLPKRLFVFWDNYRVTVDNNKY